MAGSSGDRYWYKISVQTLRVWSFLLALAVVGLLGFMGYGSLRRHFVGKQIETAMNESRNLMERLRTEDELFNFRTEWDSARSSLEQARVHISEGEIGEALESAERSRGLLLQIHEGLLKRTGGEAHFFDVQGQVEYRRGEGGEWTPATNVTALYEGDYIKTSKASSAQVMTSDGVHFTVRPDTVIVVSSSRSSTSRRREQTIALESGWVNLSTSERVGRVKTPGGTDAKVNERTQASFAYDVSSKTTEVATYSGVVDVTASNGETRVVKELERVRQEGDRLGDVQKLPPAPALLVPANNDEVSIDANSELTLTWEPVKGASRYALQVSTNTLFVDNVIDDDSRRRPRARLGLRGEGTFVWRVAAYDSSGAMGPWSLYNRFRVTSQQTQGEPGAL